MNSITQDILYKQSVVKYSFKHGVTKAAIKFKMHRKTIYRWREKYDGTAKSLKNKSRRPHSHPKQHTAEEIKKIKDYKYKNKETGLVVLWVKLRKSGNTRSITSLYRVMQKLGIYNKAPSKKKEYEPKLYQQMTYPGASDSFSKMGIYDLAGNVYEWTLEYTSSIYGPSAFRGGYYDYTGSSYPASSRGVSSMANATYDIGCRVALY